MSPLRDCSNCITTASGHIDFAYYDNQARMARSRAFGDYLLALRGWFERFASRLTQRMSMRANNRDASPCG